MNTINIALTALIFFWGVDGAAYVIGDTWHIDQVKSFAPYTPDQIRAQSISLNSTFGAQSQGLDAFAFLANAIFSNNVIGPTLFTLGGGIMVPMLMKLGLHPMLIVVITAMITSFTVYALVFIIRGMKS